MSCTPAEIAEKRRIALERLKQRQMAVTAEKGNNLGPSKNVLQSKATNTFYGNEINSNKNMHVIKSKTFNNLREESSPYSRKAHQNEPRELSRSSPVNLAPVFKKMVTCTPTMITDTRFMVKTSGYSELLISVFKTVPTRNYDKSSNSWSFHLKDYSLVIQKVTNLKPDVVIGTIPKHILNIFTKETTDIDVSEHIKAIEPNLLNVLMQFQKEGVCFGISKHGRCLIADEMGLGKTYQALALADFYKDDWPMLICTTASTRDTWATKIRTLLPYVPCHNIINMTTTNDYINEAKILILSYSLMEKNIKKLLEIKFGVVIMDESHTLKNFKAKCTTCALQLAKQADRVILLSGTPALSRPVELFTQLQMLDKSFLNFKEYSSRYCEGKQTNFGWDASGQSNLAELNLVLNKKFMIRRTKSEVLSQMAAKKRETVVLDPMLVISEDSDENLNSYAEKYTKSKGRKKEEILLKYYAESGKAKSKAVCSYIRGIVKDGTKFIVFAHHHFMLDSISNCLNKLNTDYIRIDGTTRGDIRSQYVDKFQKEEKCKAAVLSLKACNAGITLTAAQLVLFAELDWNPSTLAQAESRAHRIGQDGQVVVRYLIAKNTADDVIWQMLQNKQNVLSKAGLCNEDFSDATHKNAPPELDNTIDSYFEKTNSSSTIDNNYVIPPTCSEGSAEKNKEEIQALLDDDDDDDFANLDF